MAIADSDKPGAPPVPASTPLPHALDVLLRKRGCTRAEAARPERIPKWFLLGFAIALGSNVLASITTYLTIDLMHGPSEFARMVRRRDLQDIAYFRMVTYPAATTIVIAYLWPIIAYFRCGAAGTPPLLVQRRVISAPLFLSSMGFAPWLFSATFFPLLTLHRYGRWTTDLMSQHVLSPLCNGFLAATVTYLLSDWIFRTSVIPRVFPEGRLTAVPGTVAMRVRSRLLVFLLAVAFIPMFTMLGLVRAAAVRVQVGLPAAGVVSELAQASSVTFFIYVALGIALTLVLARSLTRPLVEMAASLRRVQAGDLDVNVRVESSDEVGILQDGVNAMVATLNERDRILQTFGRVVEPAVRDHILSGQLALGGQLRLATVMFVDLRGFTALAERTPPAEVVQTLNEFFTEMTAWVRECGGFVDKFIGDAMMIVFGLFDPVVPDTRTRSAAAAVHCALGMRRQLAELNTRRGAAGRTPLAFSAGVHTGEVLAGLIGAEDRHEYTVIGDTVNVAHRLQALCKEQERDILISDATYRAAQQAGITLAVETREAVTLRGRSEPVRVLALD